MSEYKLPLTRPRSHDFSRKEVEGFFNVIAMIPNQFFEEILDGFNKDYKPADKQAIPLIRSYLDNRGERNDEYFKTLTDIHVRLFEGKALFLDKPK